MKVLLRDMKSRNYFTIILLIYFVFNAYAQEAKWHNKLQELHYIPDGKSFVLNKGNRKFNRAIYGTNTGFRVEAGDLPEFAMYMPGMGGNFKLGIIKEGTSKWIYECDSIETRYTPGTMQYKIKDSLFQKGTLHVQILALANDEGFVIKVNGERLPSDVLYLWTFGGASGKKFSRNGDIGADPESVFYLHPEYCINNEYTFNDNSFHLQYGSVHNKKKTGNDRSLTGLFPTSEVKLTSASRAKNPIELFESEADSLPVISGKFNSIPKEGLYWIIANTKKLASYDQVFASNEFAKALKKVNKLASRVEVKTPDPYINTLGGALATAADAIWEEPAFLHGAVAWRMHLNAWRGAYVANPLGWHDRAKLHFESYGNSQVTEPETGPFVPDSLKNMTRQEEKIGNSMFSKGYISRYPNRNDVAHHYDMNLVFIDQLLRHFKWTGDIEFIKKMWPVIRNHLEWEKRNFDVDNNGLYDAYASIWASDALQYSGGDVTHSSSYNYYANKMTAELAKIIGEDESKYKIEADKIHKSLQQLWLEDQGWFAEYKDALGNKLLHTQPGLWTIYHAIDSEVCDPFQAYTMLRYVDNEIPHIPFKTNGVNKDDLYLLSTTNWQPYTWSVNNVALAEILHTALAYWKGNRKEEAYKIWESALIQSMYLGASPGAFEQLLFQDAMRGELYRDFADPIGMAARTLVEGLFGIQPNALENVLTIEPGFPVEWSHASIETPDIKYSFEKKQNVEIHTLEPGFKKQMILKFITDVRRDKIKRVLVNQKPVLWNITESIGSPKLIIEVPAQKKYTIKIEWGGKKLEIPILEKEYVVDEKIILKTNNTSFLKVFDPQNTLKDTTIGDRKFSSGINSSGNRTAFVKVKQNEMVWWIPLHINAKAEVEHIETVESGENLILSFRNNEKNEVAGIMEFNPLEKPYSKKASLLPKSETKITVSKSELVPGTNKIVFHAVDQKIAFTFINWSVKSLQTQKWKKIDLYAKFNSSVADIFKNQYVSPRSQSSTLQLPIQGVGNWCYPTIFPVIDDSGIREKAKYDGEIKSPQNIPFKTPYKNEDKNIIYTSLWDNYPDSISVDLTGKASHAYFLMAGTTNPMQSRIINGEVTITYVDGTQEVLVLKNPENWWPIEQDYYTDGYAFTTNAPKLPRVYLKSGIISREFKDFIPIKGFSDFGIHGGAATILDVPLDNKKELKNIQLKTIANDVIIGLMSVTLAID